MPAEGFFQRWSRLKAEPGAPLADAPVPDAAVLDAAPQAALSPALVAGNQPAPLATDAGEAPRLPSLDDVAELHAGSDYAAFVARGVDQAVRRGALKKLFADPHFNIGDGLDLYMGDYNKPDPIPAAMMSALRHTQRFFAQAYPDKKSDQDDPDMPVLASDDTAAPPTLADMEPPMTDTTGATATTGSAMTDAAADTATSEDKA